ncbi:hypothetical protein BG015_008765 [Linnemannia schmuckeri]|uniref:Uncharacterized protein n=1 Tax=Linnemannia schmuckeri TaxID=64567 RepID=A0A9P5VAF5_9FUNG|nr:hypothetical protein BG015_008765 [Linnemannia schmuckeri]
MHSSTALSSSSLPSASNSRPQRLNNNNNNRKSGLASALQNQNQNRNQTHTQSLQNNSYNGNSNPRHTQRVPEQVNSRHQSMPPQQRGYANNNSKPRVDTATARILVAETADSGALMRHVHYQQQQRQQRNQFPHLNNSKPRPQSQPQPSKARRVQRHREIDSMTESLTCVDLDLALNQSPPLNPSSPPSSSDSDDSESTLSRSNHFSGSKAYRHLINSPPQRPSSAPTPQTHYAQRTGGVSRANLPFQAYSATEMKHRPDSADKVMLVERVPAEKSGLYAGPTFHNSPAPTSLPIPSFARSLGNSPVEPSVEKLPSAPFFGEAASPQLNSMRLQSSQQSIPNWSGYQSTPTGMSYNVPDHMATSSFVPHGSIPHGSDQLMEISQNLRMLLKIQSQ